MTIIRTTAHGLQWVVSVVFVAVMCLLTAPGMAIYGSIVVMLDVFFERMFGINLFFVSMLASACILVLAVRFIALPLALKGFGR